MVELVMKGLAVVSFTLFFQMTCSFALPGLLWPSTFLRFTFFAPLLVADMYHVPSHIFSVDLRHPAPDPPPGGRGILNFVTISPLRT